MSIIFFLLVFLAPLGVYLLNAYHARRPTGIAGGVEPAKKAKKAETPKPRRAKATVTRPAVARDCGRTWAHLCLALVGARDACRWCETERREPVPFPPQAASERVDGGADGDAADGVESAAPSKPPAMDILAEVEKILDDSRTE